MEENELSLNLNNIDEIIQTLSGELEALEETLSTLDESHEEYQEALQTYNASKEILMQLQAVKAENVEVKQETLKQIEHNSPKIARIISRASSPSPSPTRPFSPAKQPQLSKRQSSSPASKREPYSQSSLSSVTGNSPSSPVPSIASSSSSEKRSESFIKPLQLLEQRAPSNEDKQGSPISPRSPRTPKTISDSKLPSPTPALLTAPVVTIASKPMDVPSPQIPSPKTSRLSKRSNTVASPQPFEKKEVDNKEILHASSFIKKPVSEEYSTQEPQQPRESSSVPKEIPREKRAPQHSRDTLAEPGQKQDTPKKSNKERILESFNKEPSTPKPTNKEKQLEQNQAPSPTTVILQKDQEVKKYQQIVQQLNGEVEKYKRLDSQEQAFKDMMEEMKNQAAVLRQQFDKTMSLEQSRLMADLNRTKRELEAANRICDEKHHQVSVLSQRIAELEEELSNTKSGSVDSEEAYQLKQENEKLRAELQQMREKDKHLEIYANSLQEQVISCTKTNRVLKEERNNIITSQSTALEKFNEILESSIHQENQSLKGVVDKLRLELQERKKSFIEQLQKLRITVNQAITNAPTQKSEQEAKKALEQAETQLFPLVAHNSSIHVYHPTDPNDDIDVAVCETLQALECPVRIEFERVAPGEYRADRKLKVKLLNDQVVVSNGVAFQPLTVYIKQLYAPFFLGSEDTDSSPDVSFLEDSIEAQESAEAALAEKLAYSHSFVQKVTQKYSPNKAPPTAMPQQASRQYSDIESMRQQEEKKKSLASSFNMRQSNSAVPSPPRMPQPVVESKSTHRSSSAPSRAALEERQSVNAMYHPLYGGKQPPSRAVGQKSPQSSAMASTSKPGLARPSVQTKPAPTLAVNNTAQRGGSITTSTKSFVVKPRPSSTAKPPAKTLAIPSVDLKIGNLEELNEEEIAMLKKQALRQQIAEMRTRKKVK